MRFVLPDLTGLVVTNVPILHMRRLRFRKMKEHPGQSHNSTLDTGSEQKSFSPTLRPLPLTGKRAQREPQKGYGGETQQELVCLDGRTSEGAELLG